MARIAAGEVQAKLILSKNWHHWHPPNWTLVYRGTRPLWKAFHNGRYAKSLIMESSRFKLGPSAAGERVVPILRFT